ncbi:glutathione S-transferase family protein [Paracidovorax oryzae]|uniref:glutathione S-transferase family protein n=1 Tax=Paracidovorax oryzae TaxID=862720 RepID=UPI00030EF0C4|nr:glutathione S-transferase [Paracidovorax oryzae]
MQLYGMLDSPYVRRVAVTLRHLGLPFEHRPLSVFGDFDAFGAVNPVVKAPTLVADGGTVLMDSTLMLHWIEARAPQAAARLVPEDPAERLQDLRVTGLALAACEKAVQIVYEQRLRPPEKRHQPWLDRIGLQLDAAHAQLEEAIARVGGVPDETTLTHGGIAAAVAWSFIGLVLPGRIGVQAYPALAAFAAAAENLPAFMACPQAG